MPRVPQPNQFGGSTGQFARAGWVKINTPNGATVYRPKTGTVEFSEDIETFWGLSMAVNDPFRPMDTMFEALGRTRVVVNYLQSGHEGERWLMPYFQGYPLISAALTQRDLGAIDAGRARGFEPGTRFGVAYGWAASDRGQRSFADFLCFDPELFRETQKDPEKFTQALDADGHEEIELPWVTPMQIGASSFASAELMDELTVSVPIANSLGRPKARQALYKLWEQQDAFSPEDLRFAREYIEAYCANDDQPQLPLFIIPAWIGPGDKSNRTGTASGQSSPVVRVRNYMRNIDPKNVREMLPHVATPDMIVHMVNLLEQYDKEDNLVGGSILWSQEHTQTRIEAAARQQSMPVTAEEAEAEADPFE